jgi:hypothetical protein
MMPKNILSAMAAAERMELYYRAHPGSPSAICRPQLSIRCGVWVALLGESVQKGIAGFGATVEAALSAFDAEYFNTLRQRETKPAFVISSAGRNSFKQSRYRRGASNTKAA